MATKDDHYLPSRQLKSHHRRSLTEENTESSSTPSLQNEHHSAPAHDYDHMKNGDNLPISIKKRRSDAAIYIKTSQLFTLNNHNSNKHSNAHKFQACVTLRIPVCLHAFVHN